MRKIRLILLMAVAVIGFILTPQNAKAAELDEDLFPFCNYYSEIYEIGEKYQVDPCLIVAMIDKESNWDEDAYNSGCVGLMQINPKWQKQRMEELGLDDLTDPLQNIECGAAYISDLIQDNDGNVAYALMSYNGGPAYLQKMKKAGKTSSYAKTIMNTYEELASRPYY